MSVTSEDRVRRILQNNLPSSMWDFAGDLARRLAREGLLADGPTHCTHSTGLVERPVCEDCGTAFP